MPSNATIDRNGKTSMIMIPAKSYEQPSLAYIDLDLPKVDDDVFTPPSRTATINKKSSNPNFSTEKNETIYKEVDFEKTKAWNLTRKDRSYSRFTEIIVRILPEREKTQLSVFMSRCSQGVKTT